MGVHLLQLPGEIRNMIYDLVAEDTEQIIVQKGFIIPHPLTQVCRQTNREFTSVFGSLFSPGGKRLRPQRTLFQIEDFDFQECVRTLDRFVDASETHFDIEVRVTKQLGHTDWKKMWSWIEYCDAYAKRYGEGLEIETRYLVDMGLSACNAYAACHELYVEIVPYMLKGAAWGEKVAAGWEQIEKVRTALKGLAL